MKHMKYILLVILTSILFSGCELDPRMTKDLPEETVFTKLEHLDLRVYGYYELLKGYGGGISADAMADLVKLNEAYNSYNYYAIGLTLITPNSIPLTDWNNRYSFIRSCNEFLKDMTVHGHILDADDLIIREAEIRFFIAMLYFDLAKWHGGNVILIKELTSESLPLSDPDTVWDFIAEDLDFATKHLPTTWPAHRGRITKGGAYGLKAKAMLYAERWEAASNAAAEVIKLATDENVYALTTNYADALIVNRNTEAIIEYSYKVPDLTTGGFDAVHALHSDPYEGRAQANPTEECVSFFQMADGTDFDWNDPAHAANPYENREPRFYASILYNGAEWKKALKKKSIVDTSVAQTTEEQANPDQLDSNIQGKGTVTGYYLRKLLDESLTEYTTKGERTHYYMRYAEVLLIHAEALAQQGKFVEGLVSLNKVRTRAKLPDVSASNKTEFMNLIRKERVVELAFEGHRYWDLRRWGLAESVLHNVNFHGTKITKTYKPVVDGSGQPVLNEDGSPKMETIYHYMQVDCDEGFKRYYEPRYNKFPIPNGELSKNINVEQFPEWR